jgi:hypothetical protein
MNYTDNNISANIENKLSQTKKYISLLESISNKLEEMDLKNNYNKLSSDIANKQKESVKYIQECNACFNFLSNLHLSEDQRLKLVKFKDQFDNNRSRIKTFNSNLVKFENSNTFNSKLSSKNLISDTKEVNFLMDENDSLSRSFKISSSLTVKAAENIEEISNQNKSLTGSQDKLEILLTRIPIINNLIYQVGYYKLREQVILGIVTGICVYILLTVIIG